MIRNIVVLALIPAAIIPSPAAQLKEARVTEVVKDVKLLPSGGAPRPAAVSDDVRMERQCGREWNRAVS